MVKLKLKLSLKNSILQQNSAKQSTKGRKRKFETFCGKEIVNNEEVRRKNREAARKSRKKRKLEKQNMKREVQELRESNCSLKFTCDVLTKQYQEQSHENQLLREELSLLRTSHEKLQKELDSFKKENSSVKTEKASAVFRTADSGLSQQRTFVEAMKMMLCVHLLATHNPTYLENMLQVCSATGMKMETLLTHMMENGSKQSLCPSGPLRSSTAASSTEVKQEEGFWNLSSSAATTSWSIPWWKELQ